MLNQSGSPFRARIYWLAIIAGGSALSVAAFADWRPQPYELYTLILYVALGIFASGFKIILPGLLCTLSMNYVFIIAGLMDLHLRGGLVIAMSSVLAQMFIRAKLRPKWEQALFNVAGIALPVFAANQLLQITLPPTIDRFGIFPVVTASIAYFTVNTLVLAGIIGLTSRRPPHKIWQESYLWTAPQYIVGGMVAGSFHLVNGYLGWLGILCTIPVIYLVYKSYSVYLARVDQQQKHIADMAELHLRTIETLALAIDAKDDTTAAHLRRVEVYASEIGKELGLAEDELQALKAAALLHDIGKLAVPEYIISKPGKLTADEFDKMKIHPVVGAEILERVHFPYPVAPIVRSHHEKFDGSGYPDGLSGDEIPIGARILSAVDCLDALASERQYRPAMPVDEAMLLVSAESGKSFDPRVVDCLERRYRDLELKARAEGAGAARSAPNAKVERGGSPTTGLASVPAAIPEGEIFGKNFRMAISDARLEFQTLVEITNDLGSSLSLSETLALLAVRLEKTIHQDAVVIYIRQGSELVPSFVKGESFRLFSSLRIPIGQGISGWVAENDRVIVNGNPAVEPGYLNDPRKVTPLRSAIAVPLRGRDHVIGVLALYHLQADAFTPDHRRILVNISSKVGLVIENSLRFQRAKSAAETDELTGLLNPKSLFNQLHDQVAACATRGGSLAVIVMDLDGFKNANDEHGHLAGNRILQLVASGLRRMCRASDLVARLGGDEFVMVLPEPGDYAETAVQRLSEIGAAAAAEAGCRSRITISAGVATYPFDAFDAENLLEKADERMYENKRAQQRARPPRSLSAASQATASLVS
jgi:diguanylate cyclase (GGDEF)-like protein/putative nucleotidyltransferase with HDIG domain